jgi:hypothetical protein
MLAHGEAQGFCLLMPHPRMLEKGGTNRICYKAQRHNVTKTIIIALTGYD